MTPNQARIEAALRLADAVTTAQNRGWTLPDCVEGQWHAYRATLPKLRTRAEVDAEIATVIRDYHRHITRPGWKEQPDWDSFSVGQKNELNQLCAEPTAPEEPTPLQQAARQALDRMEASDPPDPCGCDQSNDLSRKLQEIQTEVDLWMRGHKGGTSAMSAIGLILKGE